MHRHFLTLIVLQSLIQIYVIAFHCKQTLRQVCEMERKNAITLHNLMHSNEDERSCLMYAGHRVVEEETDDGFDESDSNRTVRKNNEREKKKNAFQTSNGKTAVRINDDSVARNEISNNLDEDKREIVTNRKTYLNLSTKKNTGKKSYEEEKIVSSDAINKRIAWKNSTAVASERDSVLTASGDDRSSSSCEMRPEKKSEQDFGMRKKQEESSFEKENSNRLTVPSPGRKAGFYSTTPSTDEGIVTDDQMTVEDPSSPAKAAVRPHANKITTLHVEEKLPREKINIFMNSQTNAAEQPPHISYMRSQPSTNDTSDNLVRRQASEHVPKYSLMDTHSSAHAAWTSVSSCYEFGRNDRNIEDRPIVLYSRSPTEVRSCESKLPVLFERRETEVVSRNGTNISRILPNQNKTTNCIKSPSLEQTDNSLSSPITPVAATRSNSIHNINKASSSLELKLNPANADSDFLEERNKEQECLPAKFSQCDSLSLQSNASFSTKDSRKDSCSNPIKTKTPSRTGSARSTAIAEALSSVVVATATGTVMPGRSHLTSTEKQKSLTERLMTVGPSDPRRVQGIVEDILCEMGEERIIQYKDAFGRFDKDSSGIISSKQLRSLLRSLGHNPTDVELRELVNQVDMDENGKIDFNEFIIMIGYFDKANNENEDLINIFRVFDRHEKGCIDVDELRNIWNNFLHEITPEDTFEEMLSVVDSDGNGEINRVELLELLSTR